MLIEFGTNIGNGFDVVSSYNMDTELWTTQVFNSLKEPVCDVVISRTEEGARFDNNQMALAFGNRFISGYVIHNAVRSF